MTATFEPIETLFKRQPNGWFHCKSPLPTRFKRQRGDKLVITKDEPDPQTGEITARVKAWGDNLNEKPQPLNGIELQFEPRGPNAFQVRIPKAEADTIRSYKPPMTAEQKAKEAERQAAREKMKADREARSAAAKADRIAKNEEAFSQIFGPGDGSAPHFSPTVQARRWCYHLYDKGEGKTPLYYWFRSAINTDDQWRKRKPALEAQVAKELQAGKDWLDKWRLFVEWWDSIPKQGVYNDIYLKLLLSTFEEDIRTVEAQVAMTEEHGWRGELKLAIEEQPLEEWPESEDWDDGFMWFRHTETGVLFVHNLLWLHMPEQRSPWRLNSYWEYNKWALKEKPLDTYEGPVVDRLWFHVNKGVTTVGPRFKLTNRLMTFRGGYTQNPNHLYAPIKDSHVKAHAATNPPPVPVPLI